ncbi:hypothetical protein [Blastopirellula marina]|uniref:Uncharacterized protein n=1 Tax=Blastopirellula marina TaxID=124 RepID=A0A2S8GLG5_9BACT|nr:hypothetical protein [Blastopirellula marina]PQO45277.1 hypothetical protein C5Y93_15080 [Blastopirellula marina]
MNLPRVIAGMMVVTLLSIVGSGLLVDDALANGPDPLVQDLLTDGWQVGPDGMDVVRRANVTAGERHDPDIYYVVGLAQLRHHQYDAAAEAFSAAIKLDRMHYRSWRGLIWVRTLQEKFDNALVQTIQLGKELPTSEAVGDEETKVLETVRLLGRLFGFYEGPRIGDVSGTLVQRARDAVTPALVGKRQAEFENNYQDVTTLFTASTTEHQDAKDDAIVKEQMEKLQTQQDLAMRRRQIDIDKQQATQRIDQLRSDWSVEVQKFDTLEAPLNNGIGQLESQQRVIRRELSLLVNDIFQLTAELEKTKDQGRRDRLQREIIRLERLVNDYERDLALVQAEGRRLTSSRNVLRTRRLQAQQQFEAEIKQHADRRKDLERAEKRLDLETRRNNRPATGNSTKVRVLNAKASSIRTYADFPLEVERLTLLGN